jgi:hypothetical protein
MRSWLYDNISKRLRIAANPSLRQRYLRRLERNNRNERDASGESVEGAVTRRSTGWLSEM